MTVTSVLRSEWAKVHTVHAPLISLACVLLTTVGISALACATYSPDDAADDFDPVFYSFFGLSFGQLAALCFGVLVVTGEYKGGALSISLAAVPRRGLLYGCKLAVIGGLGLTVGLVTGFASFLGGQALLGDRGVGLGEEGALRAALGCGLYLGLIAVLAAGVATLLRGPVAALGLLIPVLTFVQPVLGATSAVYDVTRFLPDAAGQSILHATPEQGLGPWTGLAVLALWTAALAVAGWSALERRDA
ncbi:ABC transporter permease subunit [Streptomyces zagrosensis]|uniref:ABC-type transport system involved in multi-copper enzyme maturation permease subunit n=1 Tax=Streptomyces zagrosensis TaxID=1042984 RepID=A0A7W9V0C4_9ACTN|nr:ABC transporter permease subunit [Streptomyces zagrosensis]MBB5937126.1 ABC-type transport system involved in multi-copper enzyme maturation permease subunit [Streptomyces zagrosensis]